MTIATEPLTPIFGAAIAGIDIAEVPDPATVAAFDRLMDAHAVCLLRGPVLDEDRQIAFTRAFGPLDVGFKQVAGRNPRLKHHEIGDISNLAPDGSVAARSHRRIVSNIANRLWHSDSSFQRPAAKYSMLMCAVVPSWGGETEIADMRAAYDGLPQRIKAMLGGLEAEHYALHSRFMLGDDDYSADQRNAIAPVRWPVVRTHPGSGRRHLFIGAHARSIVGMTVPEGRMLLADLLEHATQPRYVHSHRWTPGDLLVWDNRCTLHRGRLFDLSEPRELRRSTTLDVDAPELAA
ncbi:MAG: TauD/TfdA family dioxygenase [Alphaproteobacteria bacterium]